MHPTKAGIILPGGGEEKIVIQDIRLLGRGRAAEAWLVEVQAGKAKPYPIVEKRFAPSGLTRFIYHACFQSPFPYSTSLDAAWCCLYRRKIAIALLTWDRPDLAPIVADAHYVRLMEQPDGPPIPVLGTEYIDGFGLRPPRPSPRLWKGRNMAIPRNREVVRLVDLMHTVEERFLQSGLIGSGWQVCTTALVATANFLMTEDDRFICIDLESGIPALLVPRYVLGNLRLGFPLFDDVDIRKLRNYLLWRESGMKRNLGDAAFEKIVTYVDRLEKHQRAWKESEMAVFRHRLRLLGDEEVRTRIRRRMAGHLQEHDIIDERRSDKLRRTHALFTNRDILLSLLPTSLGRGLHRLLSNRTFRSRMRRFVFDGISRRLEIQHYLETRVPKWLDRRRLTPRRAEELRSGDVGAFRFLRHVVLGHVTPAFVHRMTTDPRAIRDLFEVMAVALLSERFQYAFARHTILSGVAEWERLKRLTRGEADMLRGILARGEMQEYLKCFGMHLCLKLLEPVTSSLKIVGASLLALQHVWSLIVGLVLIFNTSVIRTLYTTWRMLLNRGRGIAYSTAFVTGLIPICGTLSFPLQMFRSRPELSTFLIRDFATRAAEHVPIYGGRFTLTEIGLFSVTDRLLWVMVQFRTLVEWMLKELSVLKKDVFNNVFRTRNIEQPPDFQQEKEPRHRRGIEEPPDILGERERESERAGLPVVRPSMDRVGWWSRLVDRKIREICPEVPSIAPAVPGVPEGESAAAAAERDLEAGAEGVDPKARGA